MKHIRLYYILMLLVAKVNHFQNESKDMSQCFCFYLNYLDAHNPFLKLALQDFPIETVYKTVRAFIFLNRVFCCSLLTLLQMEA